MGLLDHPAGVRNVPAGEVIAEAALQLVCDLEQKLPVPLICAVVLVGECEAKSVVSTWTDDEVLNSLVTVLGLRLDSQSHDLLSGNLVAELELSGDVVALLCSRHLAPRMESKYTTGVYLISILY